MSKSKKILIVLAVILGLMFIGLLVYYFFFKKITLPPTAPPEDVLGGEVVAPSEKQRLVALTQETVLGAAVVGNTEPTGQKITYVAWDGAINQIDFDGGNKEKIGLAAVERIGTAAVSSGGRLVAVKYTLSSGQNRYLIYDTEKKSLKAMPADTINLSLSPLGDELAVLSPENNVFKITTTKSDLSESKNIAATKIPDLILDWHSESSVALKTKPSGVAWGLLYNLDLKTKKISRVLGNVYGLTSLFSPSGKKVLVSETEENGFDLKLRSINLEKNTQSAVNQLTLPEKCVWSQDDRTLFCGVIKTRNDYVMPDDYYKRKIKSDGDEIVRINLDTGQTQKIIEGIFDAANLFLAPDESYLFFINKIDGRLYRLTL